LESIWEVKMKKVMNCFLGNFKIEEKERGQFNEEA
jgi:hypothetical protein